MSSLKDMFLNYAHAEGDSKDASSTKFLALLIALMCSGCGLIWSLLYFLVFGFGLTMVLPLLFVLIVGLFIPISSILKNHKPLIVAQIVCITWISALIQWSIGSMENSGLVIAWSFLGPIGALMFLSVRQALLWMGMFLGIIVVSAVFEPRLVGQVLQVSRGTKTLFYIMNLGVASTVVFGAAAWFVRIIQKERSRSEDLLSNMLPGSIATRLKNGENVIADSHHEVSVLFADIVSFTSYSATVEPESLVNDLNLVFSAFDELAAEHGVEKIKTIGDAYMACSGIPDRRDAHAEELADFALAMLKKAQSLSRSDGKPYELRIGIHSGPIVAGVIGTAKFAYDLWGDTANTASRMESHGESGKIQVSENTARLLHKDFILESRGEMSIKGKGHMEVYYLLDRK